MVHLFQAMVPVAVVAALTLLVKASTTNLFFIALMYGTNLIILFSISSAFHTAFYFNDDVYVKINRHIFQTSEKVN